MVKLPPTYVLALWELVKVLCEETWILCHSRLSSRLVRTVMHVIHGADVRYFRVASLLRNMEFNPS
jgi:hypothetical protein